jgi:GR25 family glycosyltransferase involved in LPS biosynthesis
MTFNIGIVGHVTRSEHAEKLAKRVNGFVALDSGTLGCDGNHLNVLERLDSAPADFSVVLEDDAVPTRAFLRHLKAALPLAPSGLVSLYIGKQRPPQYQAAIKAAVKRADDQDASWIIGSRLFHAVGYAIRTSLLDSLLSFDSRLPIDEHISAWAQLHGHVVSYTWPSLVDHADMPTIVAHRDGQPRTPGRVAWRTGGRETWTTTSVPL